jgi:hypothetical protein
MDDPREEIRRIVSDRIAAIRRKDATAAVGFLGAILSGSEAKTALDLQPAPQSID